MPSEESMRDMKELEEALEHFDKAPPHKVLKESNMGALPTKADAAEPPEIEYFLRQVVEQAHELKDRAVQLNERLQPILRQDEGPVAKEQGSFPQKPANTQVGAELATLLNLLYSATDVIAETSNRCEL